MPVDPQIGLQAKAPDVMGMLGQFSEIQNRLNTNRLFQQTFQARMRAGQILAGSPDLETGLKNLLQDPQTAPFAGETINSIRQGQQTLADINRIQAVTAGEYQKQADTGLSSFFKSLGPVMADPTDDTWNSVMNANLATLSPEARQRVMPAINSIKQGLMSGLPEEPQQRRSQFNQRLSGFLIAGGITPESIQAITGTPKIENVGGALVPGVQAPAGAGGAFMPAGSPLQMTAPAANEIGPFGPGAKPQLLRVPGQLPAQNMLGAQQLPPQLQAPAQPLSQPTPAPAPVPGGPTVAAEGLPIQSTKYLEERGQNMAEYQKALDSRTAVGGQIMQTVTEARNALQQFRPGAGASTYVKVGAFAQAMGAPQWLVDRISNGDRSAAQEFQKLMVNTTMGQIKEQLAGVGASRLSQMEFQAFNENNPNIDTDPRAINKIFDFWTKLYSRDHAEQTALGDFMGQGGNISEWPRVWQDMAQQRGYIQPKLATEPGAPSTGKLGGEAAAKPPREFREGTGKYKGRFFKPDPKRPGQYQEWQP